MAMKSQQGKKQHSQSIAVIIAVMLLVSAVPLVFGEENRDGTGNTNTETNTETSANTDTSADVNADAGIVKVGADSRIKAGVQSQIKTTRQDMRQQNAQERKAQRDERLAALTAARREKIQALSEGRVERLTQRLEGKDLEKISDLSKEELEKAAALGEIQLKKLAALAPAMMKAELKAVAVMRVKNAEELAARKITREKKQEAQRLFKEAREEYQTAKKELQSARKELQESATDAQKIEAAKKYLTQLSDAIIHKLEQLKSRINENENIPDSDAAALTAKIDAQITEINEIVKEIETATTKEQIKDIAARLRTKWSAIQHSVTVHAARVVEARVEGLIHRISVLEKRLETIQTKLEESGKDADISAEITAFSEQVAQAKADYESAQAKIAAARQLNENEETDRQKIKALADEAKILLEKSRASVKEAHDILKEIVKKIRTAAPEIDVSAETEVEVAVEAT